MVVFVTGEEGGVFLTASEEVKAYPDLKPKSPDLKPKSSDLKPKSPENSPTQRSTSASNSGCKRFRHFLSKL